MLTRSTSKLVVLNFVLLSSIVLTGKRQLCLKRFPSYVIPPYRTVSFVVVRHHRLGDDYWAAISYRLGFIALQVFEAYTLLKLMMRLD